jgi:Predicted acyltransferases
MSTKIEDIQVLRAFAIIFVFAQHIRETIPSKVIDYIPGDFALWVGVELFLVISGFVITRGMIARGDFRKWTLQGFNLFWKRRFSRLLPASILWIVIGLGVSFVIGLNSNDIWGNVKGSLMALTATYNLFDGYCTIYLAYGSVCPSNSITRIYWSLSLEEQFYLLLSLSLLLGHPRKILLAGLSVAISVMALRWYFPENYHIAVIHRITDRSYGLFFGVALALLHNVYAPIVARIPLPLRAASILFGSFVILYLPNASVVGKPFLAALVSTIVVALSIADGAVSKGAVGRSLMWLGERSYSLYLCHFSFLYLIGFMVTLYTGVAATENVSLLLSIIAIGSSFVVSVIAAHYSYELIEKRFLIGGQIVR